VRSSSIRVQVEHCADTLDDEEERTRLANLNAYIQCITARVERYLQHPRFSFTEIERRKQPPSDDFHAGRGLGREELQIRFQWMGGRNSSGRGTDFRAGGHFLSQATDLSWRSMIDVTDGGVEPPHGAKAPAIAICVMGKLVSSMSSW